MCPQRQMLAFEDGLEVQRKQRVTEYIARHIQIVNVVEMECLADKRDMNGESQRNQKRQVSRGSPRWQPLLSGLHTVAPLRRPEADMNRGNGTFASASRRCCSI